MAKKNTIIGQVDDTVINTEATTAATADTIVKRDASGRVKAADPVASDDVVSKQYFDAQVPQLVPTASEKSFYVEQGIANTVQYMGVAISPDGSDIYVPTTSGGNPTPILLNVFKDGFADYSRGVYSSSFISNVGGISNMTCIAGNAGKCIIYWPSTSVAGARIIETTDYGATLTLKNTWSTGSSNGIGEGKVFLYDVDTYGLVYKDGSNVHFSRTADAGATSPQNDVLIEAFDQVSARPGIYGVSASEWGVAYGSVSGSGTLKWSRSTDSGATWSTPVSITLAETSWDQMSIDVFHVTGSTWLIAVAGYKAGKGQYEIFRSTNNGTSWASTGSGAFISGTCGEPHLYATNSGIELMVSQGLANSNAIRFRRLSADDGATWGTLSIDTPHSYLMERTGTSAGPPAYDSNSDQVFVGYQTNTQVSSTNFHRATLGILPALGDST